MGEQTSQPQATAERNTGGALGPQIRACLRCRGNLLAKSTRSGRTRSGSRTATLNISLSRASLEEELSLAKMADAVVVVSEADRQVMLQAGVRSVHIVGHSISVTPTTSPFPERDAFLFVGSVHGSDNPNADSIREFCRTQWAGNSSRNRSHFRRGRVRNRDCCETKSPMPPSEYWEAGRLAAPLRACAGICRANALSQRACPSRHTRRRDSECRWSSLP